MNRRTLFARAAGLLGIAVAPLPEEREEYRSEQWDATLVPWWEDAAEEWDTDFMAEWQRRWQAVQKALMDDLDACFWAVPTREGME